MSSYLTKAQVDKILAQMQRWVAEGGDCQMWTGCTNPEGYGVIKIGGRSGRTWLTHRLMYTLLVGDIPAGMQIDHTCHSYDLTCEGGRACPHRRCLNVAHLEVVTGALNTRRGRAGIASTRAAAEITHCPKDHPYDEENTYRPPNAGYNQRMCKTCVRDRQRVWYAKNGAEYQRKRRMEAKGVV